MVGDKLYQCKQCGKMIGVIQESGATLICCGAPMERVSGRGTQRKDRKTLSSSVKEERGLFTSAR
jgi:desulfoferrodoxin-like iron-binding protein